MRGKSCGEWWDSAVDDLMDRMFGTAPSTGSKELDAKMRAAAEKPTRAMMTPAEIIAKTGQSSGQYLDLMERATLGGEKVDWASPENLAVVSGAATDVLTFLAPAEMLEGDFPIGRKARSARQGTLQEVEAGITWGKGIQTQGMPWEDYLEKQLPSGSRLPKNYKAFDFFSDETGVAISAKTLDTTTAARLAKPQQLYSSLTRNIDAAANFTSYELKGVALSSDMITARELRVAVPSSTNTAQWAEIKRAVEYGKSQGVKVIVTVAK